MNISLKKLGLLLILFTATVNIQLFSQQIKNTLHVTFTSKINEDTGSLNFNFENGTAPFQVVIVSETKMYKEEQLKEHNFNLENIPFDYYSIAITDANNLFYVGQIDLK